MADRMCVTPIMIASIHRGNRGVSLGGGPSLFGRFGRIDRIGAPWSRFASSCRESPDAAGRRRLKRPTNLPRKARGENSMWEKHCKGGRQATEFRCELGHAWIRLDCLN